jgi:hypothetical protein
MTSRIAPLCTLAFVALGSAAAMAQTFEMPLRKPGLWEIMIKVSAGNTPAITMQQCTDPTTDKAMSTMFGGPQQMCSEQKMQQSGDAIIVDSVCTIAGVKSASHAVIKGDFNSAYTVNVTSKREGNGGGAMMAPAGDSTVAMEAKWAGPCKADQKPGDMIMPGGIKMNIADLQKLRGMMGPPGGGAMAPQGGMMAPPPRGGMMAPQK